MSQYATTRGTENLVSIQIERKHWLKSLSISILHVLFEFIVLREIWYHKYVLH